MNPDDEVLDPIDPPDNTGTGTNIEADPTAGEETAQAPAINPPDNT